MMVNLLWGAVAGYLIVGSLVQVSQGTGWESVMWLAAGWIIIDQVLGPRFITASKPTGGHG